MSKPKYAWKTIHDDLAILWVEAEGLKYEQVIEKMVTLFGEDFEIDVGYLNTRIGRRRLALRKGEAQSTLSDEAMMDMFKGMMYSQVLASHKAGDGRALRQNIETALKVIRARNTVVEEPEDAQSEVGNLLERIQQQRNLDA